MLGDPVRLIVRTERIARVSRENHLCCSGKCWRLSQLDGRGVCSWDSIIELDGLFRHRWCLEAEELAATEPQG